MIRYNNKSSTLKKLLKNLFLKITFTLKHISHLYLQDFGFLKTRFTDLVGFHPFNLKMGDLGVLRRDQVMKFQLLALLLCVRELGSKLILLQEFWQFQLRKLKEFRYVLVWEINQLGLRALVLNRVVLVIFFLLVSRLDVVLLVKLRPQLFHLSVYLRVDFQLVILLILIIRRVSGKPQVFRVSKQGFPGPSRKSEILGVSETISFGGSWEPQILLEFPDSTFRRFSRKSQIFWTAQRSFSTTSREAKIFFVIMRHSWFPVPNPEITKWFRQIFYMKNHHCSIIASPEKCKTWR